MPSRLLSSAVFVLIVLWQAAALAADPTTADCLNANEKSIELRNRHLLLAARTQLLLCAAATCPEDVRNECTRRVGEVNAAMPTIVFEARDPSENDLSEVTVTMDGQLLFPRLEGTALSIDPGEHEFELKSPQFPAVRKRLIVREGEKGRREKVVFGEPLQRPAPAPQPLAAGPTATSTDPAAPRDAPSNGSMVRRVVGIGVGAAGVVSLGIAIADQLTARSRDADSRRAAASDRPEVRATALQLHDQARQAQTYAIVFGVVGAAALGTGLYLVLSSLGERSTPHASATKDRLVPFVRRDAVALHYIRNF